MLQDKGWISSKPVQEREIKEYRWVRSVEGAGLVNRDYLPNLLTDGEIPARANLAQNLWHKDPYEFAHWCIENDHPFPQHFLVAEFIPWQMEQFADAGVKRNHAASLSIRLCRAVRLLTPNPIQSEIIDILPTDSPAEALRKKKENHKTEMRASFAVQQQDTADMYLDTFIEHFTPSEQIELLKACQNELEINPDSHRLNEHQLLTLVIGRKREQEMSLFIQSQKGKPNLPVEPGYSWTGSDDVLIDFDTELDPKTGLPKSQEP